MAYRSIGPRITRRIPSENKDRVNAQLIADPADYFIWAFTLSGWLSECPQPLSSSHIGPDKFSFFLSKQQIALAGALQISGSPFGSHQASRSMGIRA